MLKTSSGKLKDAPWSTLHACARERFVHWYHHIGIIVPDHNIAEDRDDHQTFVTLRFVRASLRKPLQEALQQARIFSVSSLGRARRWHKLIHPKFLCTILPKKYANLPDFNAKVGRRKTAKQRTHKGIWWSLCLGSVPGTVGGESPGPPTGRPDLLYAQFNGRNGIFPWDKRDTSAGWLRSNMEVSRHIYWFFLPTKITMSRQTLPGIHGNERILGGGACHKVVEQRRLPPFDTWNASSKVACVPLAPPDKFGASRWSLFLVYIMGFFRCFCGFRHSDWSFKFARGLLKC